MGRIFKKTTALLLVGMMTILSAAGCTDSEDTKEVFETEPETSVVSTSETEESEPADPMSEKMIKKIKDKIAEEAAKTDHKIDILFWDKSTYVETDKEIINNYIKKFEDDRYELNVKTELSLGADKMIKSSEDGADVFYLTDDQVEICAKEKVLSPVDEFYEYHVSKSNTDNSVRSCTVDNTLYAFPRNINDTSLILYYDKRIFKDDEVGDINQIIKKADENNRRVYWSMTNIWHSSPVFLTAGCELTNDNGKLLFDSSEGLNAAKAMCELAKYEDKGFYGTGAMRSNSDIDQPTMPTFKIDDDEDYVLDAAAIYGTSYQSVLREQAGEENLGAAKLPSITINGEEKQLEAFGGYDVLGVNAQTNYPFTAQTLAYYLTEKNVQLQLYEKFNTIPTNLETLESDLVKDDPAIKAFEDQWSYYHPITTGFDDKYWSAGVDKLGIEIIQSKGEISDEKLKEQLKTIQSNMS